jgi:hypothetical protein
MVLVLAPVASRCLSSSKYMKFDIFTNYAIISIGERNAPLKTALCILVECGQLKAPIKRAQARSFYEKNVKTYRNCRFLRGTMLFVGGL